MSAISREDVRRYLVATTGAEPRYVRAREIAAYLDASPRAVGQYLLQLQDSVPGLSLEQWSRSKSTTWRVEVTDA